MNDNFRCFEHIAQLIRKKRINHSKGYSQSELSHLLGYKNGQFISNVERALCNIPLKMLSKVTVILDITPEEIKEAILQDHEKTLNNYFQLSPGLDSDANNLEQQASAVSEEVQNNPTPTYPGSFNKY